MALILRQVRRCDGQCCKDAPRFPLDMTKRGAERGGCIYFDEALDVTVPGGGRFCKLLADTSLQDDLSLTADGVYRDGSGDRSELEWFDQTCAKWPQNLAGESVRIGKTDSCCWQFVEE